MPMMMNGQFFVEVRYVLMIAYLHGDDALT
jgi:hypothetical protein